MRFYKKETLAQVFSCEFGEISKNTFFHRTTLVAASGYSIFMFSLTHIALYCKFSTKRQQSSNPIVHVLTFFKKTTWFQSSSPEFHFPQKDSVVQTK